MRIMIQVLGHFEGYPKCGDKFTKIFPVIEDNDEQAEFLVRRLCEKLRDRKCHAHIYSTYPDKDVCVITILILGRLIPREEEWSRLLSF